jgi:hypothetical protein
VKNLFFTKKQKNILLRCGLADAQIKRLKHLIASAFVRQFIIKEFTAKL